MEIRIGIVQSMRELEIELGEDADLEAMRQEIDEALANDATVWLTDRKGRRVGVPASRVAYVEFSPPGVERVVGFGAG